MKADPDLKDMEKPVEGLFWVPAASGNVPRSRAMHLLARGRDV